MEVVQDYNNWIKRIDHIKIKPIKFRVYSLHNKSVQAQDDLIEDDGAAFIFCFSSDDISSFYLPLPISMLQDHNEFLEYALNKVEFFREHALNDFPKGNMWCKVDEEYIEATEKFLESTKHFLSKTAELLKEEINTIDVFE